MILMEKVYKTFYIYPMAVLKTQKNHDKAEGRAAKTQAVRAKSGSPVRRAAKPGAPKKKAPAEERGQADEDREPLAKKLRNLIPRLDAECLAFLIEQAEVYLYNTELEALSKTMAGKQGAKKRDVPAAEMRIEGSESGSSYYLIYNNQWVMFSREEIILLVNIVSVKDTDLEIRSRLFSWFERERRDVFTVIPMQDKFDEKLKKIVTLFKKTFRVRYK
jgi:hypothetical protein